MKRVLRFYKDPDNRWYVDLPEWEGEKDDLEMVSGADLLLDIISSGTDYVDVTFDTDIFDGAKELKHKGGGYYDNNAPHGPSTIWLCSVTEFVFGNYPDKIYYI